MSEAGATPATPAVSRTEKEVREAILEHTALVRKLKVKSENSDVTLKPLIGKIRFLSQGINQPLAKKATRELVSLKEEFKTVTGKEWSDAREEGPILLTTNKVKGREILPEVRERIKQLRRENFIR